METREQLNIKELVQAALSGDSGAYEALYNTTAPRMLGLARSMLRHEEDALDVLQESYLYAFKSLDNLQQPEYFSTWLYSIVSNRCKNFLTRTRPKLFAASLTNEEGGVYRGNPRCSSGLPLFADAGEPLPVRAELSRRAPLPAK